MMNKFVLTSLNLHSYSDNQINSLWDLASPVGANHKEINSVCIAYSTKLCVSVICCVYDL